MGPPNNPPLTLVRTPPPLEDPPARGLDDVFRSYSAYVAYIGIRILGQDEEIDDLVQDVFVEAVRGLGRLKEAGAIKGWLGTVTVRAASRRLRVRRVRRFFGLGDLPDYEALVAAGADPEQGATLARIYRLLDELPPRHRIAWILRVVEGEAIDDVARMCDCSRATVKRWVQGVQDHIERHVGHG
jgi:RNA polymerase sigma-70 factor (ECF subfamily)